MPERTALALALDRIARRDHTFAEVRIALAGYDEDTIDQVLAFLAERRYLDDDRVAQEFVRIHARETGDTLVRERLRQRGVPDDAITAALCDAEPEHQRLAAWRGRESTIPLRRFLSRAARNGFAEDDLRELADRETGD